MWAYCANCRPLSDNRPALTARITFSVLSERRFAKKFKNVKIKTLPFSTYDLRGIVRIAKNRDENHVILLNENKSFVEQNYHGFHELTHILTVDEPGTTLNCFGNTRPNQNSYIEWLANEGAAEFLMPYKEILPIIRNESKTFDEHSMPIFDLSEKLSNMYNVSTVVVQNRISSLSYEIWQYLSGTDIDKIQLMSHSEQQRKGINVDSLLDIENKMFDACWNYEQTKVPIKPFFFYSKDYIFAVSSRCY